MATREIVVNMVPGGVTPVIHVSQYDDGYGITANLIENSGTYTVPTGATVSIEGTKPDGHGYAYLCTYQDNAVVIPVNTQMTAVKGKHPCELVVRKDGLRVGSKNMIMAVEVAGLGEDTIISDTELPAIIALAQEQEEAAASSASRAAARATAAASSAASAETAKDAAMDAAQDAIDAAQELQTAIQFNAALIHETASGAVASFADGADNIPMQSVVAEITPVQSGSGDPSPDNIRPISGRTGMAVTRAGKNVFPKRAVGSQTIQGVTFETREDGTIHAYGTTTAQADLAIFTANSVTLPVGTYTVKRPPSNNTQFIIGGANNTSGLAYHAVYSSADYTFTITNTGTIGNTILRVLSGATVDLVFEPQIEAGSTSTDYTPYVGQTYPISWQTEAGTIYGGTLDVVSGVLTVEKGYAVYDGSEDESWKWQDGGTYKRVAIPLSDVYNPGGRVSVQSNAGTFRASGNDDGTIFASGTTLLYYPEASITSLADYKTWLASNNLQVVYPLATPQTYQLTPTEVRTLLGGNTIYTDAGGVSVEYIADTKLYIDKRIAELQALVLEN